MFHPDDSIGPYTLLRLLGRGGFGEVWLAEKRSALLTTKAALKLPSVTHADLETVRNEATLWLQASGHPNIVPVLDADVYEGKVVIASEYIAGGTLHDWMRDRAGKASSVEEAVAIANGILAGLDHLHRVGLTHRDLKPENVLLQEGIPRLTDFGLARVLKTCAQTQHITGTPRYMAPENFSGSYSVSSDLWAVGVILHELLAGEYPQGHPFPAQEMMALIVAIQSQEPLSLPDAIPERLRDVVTRLLAKAATDRYASASAVREALQNSLQAPAFMRVAHKDAIAQPPDPKSRVIPDLPTGTVTFLFTDIEGSTKLWEHFPEVIRLALIRHDALAASLIQQNDGALVRSRGEGDSLFAVFARATDAIAAACALQRAFVSEPWPAETPLRVRMALHTGEADLRDGDYYGSDVNRCARLRATAHGGQVLLSNLTQDLIRDALPEGASLKNLGQHRLRDLSRAETVFQLCHADLPFEFAPLKSLDNPQLPNNLPQQVTSFIGREKEIAEIKTLLGRSRLLTLTGSGGCGKTRLTLQVAAEVLDTYPEGVWLVELAPLSDPALVALAVADVLGVREAPGEPITNTLVGALKDKQTLLVLDNCEHVLETSARLADAVLRGCAKVRVMASSREPLGIGGETAYRVPSLSLPDLKQGLTPESLAEYESARLFTERAVSVRTDFAVSRQNAGSVAQLCHRLDGIPLAIELAAARVRSLAVEEVNSRLDDRFRLLTGGSRTALPRQQTLRALVDWSFDLLNVQERALLCRLAVFAGGWTLESAEQVCHGEDIEEWDVLDLLTSLVDKSLVVAETGEGATRYRLLETVRQYARDRLQESGAAEPVRRKHRDRFLALAEDANSQMDGPEQGDWLERLEVEHDNLRAALDWSHQTASEGQEYLRLSVGLAWFWMVRGHFREGIRRLEEALAKPETQSPTLARVAALHSVGMLFYNHGYFDAARAWYEQSLAMNRAYVDDPRYLSWSLHDLGCLAMVYTDYAGAQTLFEESLNHVRGLGPGAGIALYISNLGYSVARQGNYSLAHSLYAEALAAARAEGDIRGLVSVYVAMAELALEQGDYGTARGEFEQGLIHAREIGGKREIALTLLGSGMAALRQGNAAAARAILLEGEALCRELEHKIMLADALVRLAEAAQAQGEDVVALQYLRESLSLYQEMSVRDGVAYALEGSAALLSAQSQPDRAARLWGAAEALRENTASPLPPNEREKYNRQVGAVCETVGAAAFSAFWAEGRAMTTEQAIEYALA